MPSISKKLKLSSKLLAASLTFCSLIASQAAIAATATTSFSLRVVVNGSCQVNAADLDFGQINDISNNNDAKSALQVMCSEGLPFQIGLNEGLNSMNIAERQMKNQSGADGYLIYQLFMDESFSRIWGNTVDKDTLQDKGRGTWVSYPVFGRIPGQKSIGSGVYTDKVQVTVTY